MEAKHDVSTRGKFAEDIFDHLEGRGLTSDGANWVRHALDPFHDFDRDLAGFPDADGAASVVNVFKVTLNITKPAGAAGNWDCHIFNLPHTTGRNGLNYYTGDTNLTYGRGHLAFDNPMVQFAPLGLVNVIKADAGQPMFYENNPWAPTNWSNTIATAALEPELETGLGRIIGMGMEVENTTAELNKQGAVLMYRMPGGQPCSSTGTIVNTASTEYVQVDMRHYSALPADMDDASRLKGTRTWAAKDGFYMPITFSSDHVPFSTAQNVGASYQVGEANSGSQRCLIPPYTGIGTKDAQGNLTAACPSKAFFPINIHGAIFTGLSPETTLTLKVRIYYESAVTHHLATLATLAGPSAGLDLNALKMYAEMVRHLPVAVPVSYNSFGKFFRMIIGKAKSVIPKVLPLAEALLPPQAAAAIAAGKTAVAGVKELRKEVKALQKKRK